MKTKLLTAFFSTLLSRLALAQDVTTVNANSPEISDNLDLRAVASIFGDSRNLEDFEQRLNDPDLQISNLDLNGDNQVDYLRVIESVDGGTHLIILQAVIGRDLYQDVATIEVERDARNNVQVQVVGDVYMYGPNYIYEPVYVHVPVIYNTFWVVGYRPYFSGWYWNYYPTYYYAWRPYPIFRYRNNVHVHINVYNQYNYVSVRRSDRAVAMYNTRRSDAYARRYPARSFAQRHENVRNRYELDQRRSARETNTRSGLTASNRENSVRSGNGNTVRNANNSVRSNNSVRANNSVRSGNNNTPRSLDYKTRDNQSVRSQSNTVRSQREQSTNNTPRSTSSPRQTRAENTPRAGSMNNGNIGRDNSAQRQQRVEMPRNNPQMQTQRSQRMEAPRSNPQMQAQRAQRMDMPRNNGGGQRMEGGRGNGGGREGRR